MQARCTRRQGWQRGWVVLGWLALSVPALAQPAAPPTSLPTTGYQLPSKALQAVVDAPRAPLLQLSPRRDLAAMLQLPALPDIAEVAQPELKLAGVRIHPKTHAASRFSFASKLWLLSVADGSERQIAGLPAPLSLADLAWSPDQRSLAFRREDAARAPTSCGWWMWRQGRRVACWPT